MFWQLTSVSATTSCVAAAMIFAAAFNDCSLGVAAVVEIYLDSGDAK